MPRVLLGVAGGPVAFRASDLALELTRSGWEVHTHVFQDAAPYVSSKLLEALTEIPCGGEGASAETFGASALRIRPDVVCLAPYPLCLFKDAAELPPDGDPALPTSLTCPVLVAPACESGTYATREAQAAIAELRRRGFLVVEAQGGGPAYDLESFGPMTPRVVAEHLSLVLPRPSPLAGRRVLITSGPTQEPIDSARYLTNRSSGKMGAALAHAALLYGAQVTVVHGPQREVLPAGCLTIAVRTAQEMLEAALGHVSRSDVVIGAAAVADYRALRPSDGKIRRSTEPLQLDLVPNPDVIATLAKSCRSGAIAVGFAAEPSDDVSVARAKLRTKGLYAVASNDIRQSNMGFDSPTNCLHMVFSDGTDSTSGVMSKLDCSRWLFDRLVEQQPW